MNEEFQLDDMDIAVMKYLQKDGRMSFTEIAGELGVAVSTVRTRYNRLIDEKILRIIGRAEPEKMGFFSYTRVLIVVKPIQKIGTTLEELGKIPELSFIAQTSGKHNVEINIVCKNNVHLLKTLDKINAIEGVARIKTTTYLNVLKWGHDLTR